MDLWQHSSKYDEYFIRENKRDDPDLIRVIKLLGEKATYRHRTINIVSVPMDADWYVVSDDKTISYHLNLTTINKL